MGGEGSGDVLKLSVGEGLLDMSSWGTHGDLYFFSFFFLLSWTYYIEGSTEKYHITSVILSQSYDRRSQHHII